MTTPVSRYEGISDGTDKLLIGSDGTITTWLDGIKDTDGSTGTAVSFTLDDNNRPVQRIVDCAPWGYNATNNTIQTELTQPIIAGDNNIGNVDIVTVPAPLSTTGGGTEATALRVTVATDSTGVLSVDDNGSSLTIDGTVTANAGTNLNTSALALESGGNLASIVTNTTSATACTIYNVALTNADTEYSQALPSNTRYFSVSIMDGVSTDNFRIAYATGKVATPTAPYIKYGQSIVYSSPNNCNLSDKTLYIASSVGSKIAQIEAWA